MSLIDRVAYLQGINFKQQLSYSTIRKLMQANTQFIMEVASKKNFKVVCTSALLLAAKLTETFPNMEEFCGAHHAVETRYKNAGKATMIDPEVMKTIKDKVIKAESRILKTLKFNMNFELPFRDLDEILKTYFKDDEGSKKLRTIARMALLDVFRSGCSLFFHRINLVIAALLIALKLKTGCCFPKDLKNLNAKDDESKKRLSEAHELQTGANLTPDPHFQVGESLEAGRKDIPENSCQQMLNSSMVLESLPSASKEVLSASKPTVSTGISSAPKGGLAAAREGGSAAEGNNNTTPKLPSKQFMEDELEGKKQQDGGAGSNKKKEIAVSNISDYFVCAVIPELFPLGLNLEGVGQVLGPAEINIQDKVGMDPQTCERFYSWLAEFKDPAVSYISIFGKG